MSADRVERHDEVTSTFEVAEARARTGAPHGTVVVARRQTAGRGRLGRVWESPPGGLWMTVLLRPPHTTAAEDVPALSLVVADAVACALDRSFACDVRVRWPNDMYVDDRKLGGLLADARWSGNRMEYCLLGIGINVNLTADALSPEIRARATSMQMLLGRAVDLDAVLKAVLSATDDACARFLDRGPSAAMPSVRARCSTMGRRVRATLDDGTILEGTAADIGVRGSLLVDTPSGQRELWSCREVVIVD